MISTVISTAISNMIFVAPAQRLLLAAVAFMASGLLALPSHADMVIAVDYTYDTNNFFDTAAKRAGLEAAADRLSRIINSPLAAVTPAGTGTGTGPGWRIGFTHPGTGSSWQLSTAANAGSDPFSSGSGAANDYGFSGLAADTWILYAGGRGLSSAGVGGTATGTNSLATFDDINGPLHRGLFGNGPGSSVSDLPVWGGSISFDTGRTWHFDPATAAPSGTVDLYSIALHEIAHALGLNITWNQWTQHQTAGNTQFSGPQTVAAYNADNGTNLTSLALVSGSDPHFADNTYDSRIFAAANPNLVGTVGLGGMQDLLMEPIANFTSTLRRFEMTNVDVAALRDVGWSTVPEPSAYLLVGCTLLLAMGASKFKRCQSENPSCAG